MDGRSPFTLADELASAQAWWREAGVDLAFDDATAHWLREPVEAQTEAAAPPAPPVEVKSAPARPKIGGEAESWPQMPGAFAEWWLTAPSLDSGGSRPRVPPRGTQGAALMILVPEPEAEDTDILLSGARGKLLKNFLSAAGLAESETYLAAVLPRHTPHPDWPALAEAGLGAIALHHVALAAPRRLLVFGHDILPLLGHDPAQTAQSLPGNQPSGWQHSASRREKPRFPAGTAGRAIGFWRRWLDWTGS